MVDCILLTKNISCRLFTRSYLNQVTVDPVCCYPFQQPVYFVQEADGAIRRWSVQLSSLGLRVWELRNSLYQYLSFVFIFLHNLKIVSILNRFPSQLTIHSSAHCAQIQSSSTVSQGASRRGSLDPYKFSTSSQKHHLQVGPM